jgi:hypothetical protein
VLDRRGVCSYSVLMLKYELSAYKPMTEDEARDAIYFAVRLNLHGLPQLKGKGKVVGADAQDRAARYFGDAVTKQLLLSNVVLLKGPPLPIAAHKPVMKRTLVNAPSLRSAPTSP